MTHAGPPTRDDATWLADLRADGPTRDRAATDLHALLLRAARHEARRRRERLPDAVVADLDDITTQAADDALVAVLRRLGDFAGRARFTTWAAAFAVVDVSAKLRRHAWRGRTVSLDDVAPPTGGDPADAADTREALREVVRAAGAALTPRQRAVLVAVAVDGVPADVVADRLGTTRGAVHSIVHGARATLRAALAPDPGEPA